MRTGLLLACVILLGLNVDERIQAADWPQFLGPTRNGVYEGRDLSQSSPSQSPPVKWKKAVGHGYSGPVVAGSRLILFHRLSDNETVECLEARTGNTLWSFPYSTQYEDQFRFDDGPRATPTVSDGRVYTFGAEGMLHCLDLETGKKLWSVNVKADFHSPNGFFGMACSPLVEGDKVLLNVGGAKGAGIVAFDNSNGRVLWKATDDEASYSSPVAATIGGQRYALFFTRKGLVALDPASGSVRVQYPWRSRSDTSVNAATPLVIGDTIFLSACYGTGAVWLRLPGRGVEKLWSGDDLLSNHYATSIERNGFLYGIHGRTDPGFSPPPKLRCVDLKKHRVCWETDEIGAAGLIRVGDQLLVLTEEGELIQVAAKPEAFEPKGRAKVLSSGVRAFPALADGLLYARDKNQMVCVDLRAAGKE